MTRVLKSRREDVAQVAGRGLDIIVRRNRKPAYSLDELLARCAGKKFRIDKAWDRAGVVGREVI